MIRIRVRKAGPMTRAGTNLLIALVVLIVSVACFGERGSTSASVSEVLPESTPTPSVPWSIVPSPNRGNGRNTLNSVSCVTSTDCVAAGYSTSSTGIPRTLIESWNGTAWAVTPSLNFGHVGAVLDAVSCTSNWCMAVGDFGNADVRTFAEWWNANGRVAVAMPNPSNVVNLLTDLSCLSPSRCVAVGSYGRNHAKTLIESWNGKRWSLVTSPSVGRDLSYLHGVSCINATDCVGVGTYQTASGDRTLVESWNGTKWSVVSSPNEPNDELSAVSCSGATSCMAVGSYFKAGRSKPLAESWNGTSWSVVRTPGYMQTIVFLDGVSCSSSTSCLAVGGTDDTLIESWDGTVWSIVPSPNKGEGGALSDVSCTSSARCVAAGYFTNDTKKSGFVTKTLVESD